MTEKQKEIFYAVARLKAVCVEAEPDLREFEHLVRMLSGLADGFPVWHENRNGAGWICTPSCSIAFALCNAETGQTISSRRNQPLLMPCVLSAVEAWEAMPDVDPRTINEKSIVESLKKTNQRGGKSSVNEWVKSDGFPPPLFDNGPKVWRFTEVRQWIRERKGLELIHPVDIDEKKFVR